METYFETLRDYILAQQPDFGDGCHRRVIIDPMAGKKLTHA